LFIPAVHYLTPMLASPPPWLAQLAGDWFQLIATAELVALFLVSVLISILGTARAEPGVEVDLVEAPKWKPITMVTIGIVAFALLFESTGLIPALIALILISSLGGEEFKLLEVIGNIVVLTILCIIVFKVGLGMNIYVLRGVW
jgi:hypothetical protein